jgi:acetylornithine deacetylase/succinyl-diaminopimelate desuccinylase-like protein
MVAQLKDANNRITIPGFYEKVDELSLEQRAELESAPFDEAVYRKELDLAATDGEAGYTTRERSTIRPTLDLNGIWGGYTGAGAKTVLPSMAQAKISMRLVPNQDPDEITELFTKHFLSLAPATVKVSVSPHHGGRPFLTSTDSPAYRAAEAAMTETFGKKPIPTREGGSIPILALFQEVLQAPIILMGFGLDTDALHSPNEHYGLFNYFKGIETLAVYHHKYKEVTEKELA